MTMAEDGIGIVNHLRKSANSPYSCIYEPEGKPNFDTGSLFLVKNMLSGTMQDYTAVSTVLKKKSGQTLLSVDNRKLRESCSFTKLGKYLIKLGKKLSGIPIAL